MAVSFCKISLKVLLLRLLLGSLLFAVGCDTSLHLQSHHRPVNDMSTAVQLTNRLLRSQANGGFVYYKRVSSLSFLFLLCNNNVVVCNCAGCDKKQMDFKRKGGLQAVYGTTTSVSSGRGDLHWYDISWWYHVNKLRAMRGNWSELTPA